LLNCTDAGEDDYAISCLLMVFIAVALPRLARTDTTSYKAALEGLSICDTVSVSARQKQMSIEQCMNYFRNRWWYYKLGKSCII